MRCNCGFCHCSDRQERVLSLTAEQHSWLCMYMSCASFMFVWLTAHLCLYEAVVWGLQNLHPYLPLDSIIILVSLEAKLPVAQLCLGLLFSHCWSGYFFHVLVSFFFLPFLCLCFLFVFAVHEHTHTKSPQIFSWAQILCISDFLPWASFCNMKEKNYNKKKKLNFSICGLV